MVREVSKIVAMLIGAGCMAMGFVLFKKKLVTPRGGLNVQHGKTKFLLVNVAPGVFFALFGAAIVFYGLHQGVTLKSEAAYPVAKHTEQSVPSAAATTKPSSSKKHEPTLRTVTMANHVSKPDQNTPMIAATRADQSPRVREPHLTGR